MVGCILDAIVFFCGSNIRSLIKLIDAALRAFFPELIKKGILPSIDPAPIIARVPQCQHCY